MRPLAVLWSRDSQQWMEEEHLRSGFSTANGGRIAHWGWYVRVHVRVQTSVRTNFGKLR
jgi:hypothetical protein